MKKIALMCATAALGVAAMNTATAQVLGSAPSIICTGGVVDATVLKTDAAETTLMFLKKPWTPGCSANVSLAAGEVPGWLVVTSASQKGKYMMGANTEGMAPQCAKAVFGDTACRPEVAYQVDPLKTTAETAAAINAYIASMAGTTLASEPWSPCAWKPAAEVKAGCAQ